MTPKRRIFGLDLLRAGAVLLVVFHHSFSFATVPAWLSSCGWIGEIGVTALLLLSGYLIGQGLLRKSEQGRFGKVRHLREFYFRRWSRTLPPYYFFILMMAALFPPVLSQIWAHKEYFLFLQNVAWNIPPFYIQTWTLALLEFFYLLFPLLLFVTSKFVRHRLIGFAIPMAVLFFVPFALRAFHTQIETPAAFEETFRKWVVYRLDTPIIGVAAALVQMELPLLWAWFLRHSWIGLGTFSCTVGYHFLGCPGLYSHHWLQVLFFPACAFAMTPLLPFFCHWKFNTSLLGKAISSISQVSYSLYVSHFFAFLLGVCLLSILNIHRDQWYLVYPVYSALIVLVTWPTYFLAEEPFIRLRENPSPSYFLALYDFSARAMRSCFSENLPGEKSASPEQEETPA